MEYAALAMVNLIAMFGCWQLVRESPCWMAALAMVLFGGALAFLVFGYLTLSFDAELGRHLANVGYYIEHTAVLLTVFRLHWQRGERQWAISLDQHRG